MPEEFQDQWRQVRTVGLPSGGTHRRVRGVAPRARAVEFDRSDVPHTVTRLALDFLTALEEREMRLLAWGYVDNAWTTDEFADLADEFVLEHDDTGAFSGTRSSQGIDIASAPPCRRWRSRRVLQDAYGRDRSTVRTAPPVVPEAPRRGVDAGSNARLRLSHHLAPARLPQARHHGRRRHRRNRQRDSDR